MYSKSLLICAFALLLNSCTLKLHEETKTNSSMNMTPVKQGCLANSGSILNKFAEGKAQEDELNNYWNCLNKSVELFYGNTKSLHEDYYEPQEFVGFLEKYFLNNRKIQPELIKQAMQLKQAIVGGSVDKITKDEFLRTIGLIKTVQKVSMRLRPFMPISYEAVVHRNLNNEQLEETLSVVQESMSTLGQALEGSAGNYSFNEMGVLIVELKRYLYGINANNTWADSALTKIALIKAAKSVLIAPPADIVQKEDWPKLFYLLPRYLNHSIRVVYYMQSPRDYLHGLGLDRLQKMLLDSADLLESAISSHPDQRIDKQELDSLWAALDEKTEGRTVNLSKFSLDQESLGLIYNILFSNIFLDKDNPGAITKNNLAKIRENIVYWSEGLHAMELFYRDKLGDQDFATKSIERSSFTESLKDKLLGFTRQQSNISTEAIEDLLASAINVKTVFPYQHSLVFIPSSQEYNQLTFPHLIKLHTLNTANRIIWQAYSKDKEITEKNLGKLAEDINPLLKKFNVKSNLLAQIHSRVFEASLFLYNSDGLLPVNRMEALEMESLILSTFDRASNIHKSIALACGEAKKSSAVKIPYKCYRANFLKKVSTYWDYIPGLAEYAYKLNDAAQIDLFEKLNSFLRKGRTNEAFDVSDTRAFVLLPYYIDILFSRFDKNRDGLLDLGEAKIAFPIFKPFITEKAKSSGITEDSELLSVFTFIMAKQTLPNESMMTKAKFKYWSTVSNQDFAVGRGEIVTIFAKLLSL